MIHCYSWGGSIHALSFWGGDFCAKDLRLNSEPMIRRKPSEQLPLCTVGSAVLAWNMSGDQTLQEMQPKSQRQVVQGFRV